MKKIIFTLLSPLLILALYLLNVKGFILYYPFLISFFIGSVFLFSELFFKPCLVLRIAKFQEKDLPKEAYPYCRKLNAIWIFIIYTNALIAFFLAWHEIMDLWALYNGVISYVIIFGFMALEYLYRKKFIKK